MWYVVPCVAKTKASTPLYCCVHVHKRKARATHKTTLTKEEVRISYMMCARDSATLTVKLVCTMSAKTEAVPQTSLQTPIFWQSFNQVLPLAVHISPPQQPRRHDHVEAVCPSPPLPSPPQDFGCAPQSARWLFPRFLSPMEDASICLGSEQHNTLPDNGRLCWWICT